MATEDEKMQLQRVLALNTRVSDVWETLTCPFFVPTTRGNHHQIKRAQQLASAASHPSYTGELELAQLVREAQ